MYDILADLDLAISAAFKAGHIAKHYQENGFEQLEDKKDAACPAVTEADVEIDKYLQLTLLAQTPDYGWLSEESSENCYKDKERVWVVDPIDGTKGFIKQNGMFAISIALLEHGVPMIGVVYNPMRNQMFYCARGHGVFLNDQRMYTRNQELQDSFLISPLGRKNKPYTQALINETGQFDEVGSVAYRLALIAAGQADLTFVDHEISIWDLAAGAVMLEEQGYDLKNINGDEISFLPEDQNVPNGIIACQEHLFDDVHDTLKNFF
jgi:myo-inositol-1(or 4)-monophosphatase